MRNARLLFEEDVYTLSYVRGVADGGERDVGKRFHDREMVNGAL